MADKVSDALNMLYGTLDGSATLEDALQHLAEVTRSERFTYLSIDRIGAVRQETWPVDPESVIEYAQDFADKDLRVHRVAAGRRGLLTTQDLMTSKELAACPVHQEHYRRFPECWNTLLHAMESEGTIVAPIAQRSALKGAFDNDEKALVEVLAPHIARVVHLTDTLGTRRASQHTLIEAFDALDDGIVILDPAGVILHMNAAVNAFLAGQDGLVISNGVLAATEPHSRQALFDLIVATLEVARGLSFQLPRPIAVSRPRRKLPLVVKSYVSLNEQAGLRLVVLQIRDSTRTVLPSVQMIQSAAGLTPSEAEVVRALTQGDTPAEYARTAELSEHTVRTHLKNIRSKLGLTRQSQIVATVMRRCAI
ncbi:helix-turn-helix transcriptional regulator [Aurantimonas sp. A2-1-M11]|uniref:helix-turn-helix transcriptional regulator n=1 Tax=Aurantimonas sp. A2-1-M11 TaxID=3113712 RepID=UPI002F95C313